MRHTAYSVLAILALALLAGCGFQLRGQSPLPFASAFVEAKADSALAARLRNHLALQHKLADQRERADIVIRFLNESRSKTILSLSGTGKVREYRLTLLVSIAASGVQGKERLAPAEIKLVRDFSFSDEQLLAKEAEEMALARDMEEDALRQILRRLAFVN